MAQQRSLSLSASIGAHCLHSRYDSRETTRAARAAFLDRFEREADPDGVLNPDERRRRASHLKKAYFLRLALKSAKARRRRASSSQFSSSDSGGQSCQ